MPDAPSVHRAIRVVVSITVGKPAALISAAVSQTASATGVVIVVSFPNAKGTDERCGAPDIVNVTVSPEENTSPSSGFVTEIGTSAHASELHACDTAGEALVHMLFVAFVPSDFSHAAVRVAVPPPHGCVHDDHSVTIHPYETAHC